MILELELAKERGYLPQLSDIDIQLTFFDVSPSKVLDYQGWYVVHQRE